MVCEVIKYFRTWGRRILFTMSPIRLLLFKMSLSSHLVISHLNNSTLPPWSLVVLPRFFRICKLSENVLNVWYWHQHHYRPQRKTLGWQDNDRTSSRTSSHEQDETLVNMSIYVSLKYNRSDVQIQPQSLLHQPIILISNSCYQHVTKHWATSDQVCTNHRTARQDQPITAH